MHALAPGFRDPVLDAQKTFRAIMSAFARPGAPQALAGLPDAPAPLSPEAAAVALTLLDYETRVWLAPRFGAPVREHLRFHAGAPIVDDPADAAFAFAGPAAELPPFERFALGSDEYPDRSTTIVAEVAAFDRGRTFSLEGPGVDGRRTFEIDGLPDGIVARLAANRALFPRGVDLVLLAPGRVAALPRSVRVEEA